MLGPDCGARGSRWLHSPHQNVIVPRGTAWPVRCRVVACAEVEAELRNEPTANEGACDSHEEVVENPEPGAPHAGPLRALAVARIGDLPRQLLQQNRVEGQLIQSVENL
jgi:hypothetical protein